MSELTPTKFTVIRELDTWNRRLEPGTSVCSNEHPGKHLWEYHLVFSVVGKVRPWDSLDNEYVLYSDGDFVLAEGVEVKPDE